MYFGDTLKLWNNSIKPKAKELGIVAVSLFDFKVTLHTEAFTIEEVRAFYKKSREENNHPSDDFYYLIDECKIDNGMVLAMIMSKLMELKEITVRALEIDYCLDNCSYLNKNVKKQVEKFFNITL